MDGLPGDKGQRDIQGACRRHPGGGDALDAHAQADRHRQSDFDDESGQIKGMLLPAVLELLQAVGDPGAEAGGSAEVDVDIEGDRTEGAGLGVIEAEGQGHAGRTSGGPAGRSVVRVFAFPFARQHEEPAQIEGCPLHILPCLAHVLVVLRGGSQLLGHAGIA